MIGGVFLAAGDMANRAYHRLSDHYITIIAKRQVIFAVKQVIIIQNIDILAGGVRISLILLCSQKANQFKISLI